jgi:hypothetical protein
VNREVKRQQLIDRFAKTINSHGYAFQYAVIAEVNRLRAEDVNRQSYSPEAAEFPVAVQGSSTKIDFILRHAHRSIFLVCECKRVNPAMSNWCFMRAPFVRAGGVGYSVIAEGAKRGYGGGCVVSPFMLGKDTEIGYHLAFEVRSDEKGEGPLGRSAVEEAATQVMRGVNGLVEYHIAQPSGLDTGHSMLFVPVIFTTAALWVTDANAAEADIMSGRLDREKLTLREAQWLVLHYHQSPLLRHTASSSLPSPLGQALEQQYVRSIIIIGAGGLAEGLAWASALPPAG